MANRETRNISTTPSQEKFVQSLVDSGRYKSASEVHREALRLLEAEEHTRLLEKAIYGDLTPNEEAMVPHELLALAQEHIRNLVRQGIADRDAGRVSDGPQAMTRILRNLRARSKSA